MTYDWEDDAKAQVDADCGEYEVIGVAVANLETGEACFMDMSDITEGVLRADLLKDVSGDADQAYQNAILAMHEMYKG